MKTMESRADAGTGAAVARRRLLRPVRVRLLGAVLLQAVAAVCTVVPLVALARIAATALDGDTRALTTWAVVAAVGALVRGLAFAGALALSHSADAQLQFTARRELVDSFARRPLTHFDTTSPAAVKRVASDDVSTLHHLVGHSVLDLVGAVVTPVTALVCLLALAPTLAPVALVPILLGIWCTRRSQRAIARTMPGYVESAGQLDAAVVEYVHGVSTLRFFGADGAARNRFRERARTHDRFTHAWASGLSTNLALAQVALSPVTVTVAVVGVGAALGTDVATLAAAALLGAAVGTGMHSFAFTVQDVVSGLDAWRRIVDTVAAAPEPSTPTASLPEGRRLHTVTVRGARYVHASREDTDPALDGIDLDLEPGRWVAVVGPSGSGKSTLADVLAGLRPLRAGQVLLDGVDTREVPEEQVLSRIAYLPQHPQFLRATVRENLTLGLTDVDDDAVWDALDRARVADVVRAMPDGLDTPITTHDGLSGGQRQRLALARAILSDRPVLVLDEATSALDEETERAVLTALREHAGERTVLMAAHRLETVRDCAQIVVLEHGRAVERGTHDELLARGGAYARLWSDQHREQVPC